MGGGDGTSTDFIPFRQLEPIGLEFDVWQNRKLGFAWEAGGHAKCQVAAAHPETGRCQLEVHPGSHLFAFTPSADTAPTSV